MPKRLHLLKLVVQPIYLVEEDGQFVDQPGDPIPVPAASIAGFSAAFLEKFEQLRASVENAPAPAGEPSDSE